MRAEGEFSIQQNSEVPNMIYSWKYLPVNLVVIEYWANNTMEGYQMTFRDANDEPVPSAPANKRIQELL